MASSRHPWKKSRTGFRSIYALRSSPWRPPGLSALLAASAVTMMLAAMAGPGLTEMEGVLGGVALRGRRSHADISQFEARILQSAAHAAQWLTRETRHHISRRIGRDGYQQAGFRRCHLLPRLPADSAPHLVGRRSRQLHLRRRSQIQSAPPDIPFAARSLWFVTSGIATRCGPRLWATRSCHPGVLSSRAAGNCVMMRPSRTCGL